MQRINVVLAGVTGTGKSTAGNVLAGRECFQSSSPAASGAQRCQHTCCQVTGPSGAMVDLRIIDSPGFSDTGKPPQKILADFLQFNDVAAEGVHAFIFTVQKSRFTEEHDSALQAFMSALGQEALPRTILTFTHFDSSESLDDWLQPGSNQMLQNWSQQVGCCIGVENLHDARNARAKMLEAIFKIKTRSTPYSNAHLDEAKQWRNSFLLRMQQSLGDGARRALEEVAEGRQTRRQAERTLQALQARLHQAEEHALNMQHVERRHQEEEAWRAAAAWQMQQEANQRWQQEQLARQAVEAAEEERRARARLRAYSPPVRYRYRSESPPRRPANYHRERGTNAGAAAGAMAGAAFGPAGMVQAVLIVAFFCDMMSAALGPPGMVLVAVIGGLLGNEIGADRDGR